MAGVASTFDEPVAAPSEPRRCASLRRRSVPPESWSSRRRCDEAQQPDPLLAEAARLEDALAARWRSSRARRSRRCRARRARRERRGRGAAVPDAQPQPLGRVALRKMPRTGAQRAAVAERLLQPVAGETAHGDRPSRRASTTRRRWCCRTAGRRLRPAPAPTATATSSTIRRRRRCRGRSAARRDPASSRGAAARGPRARAPTSDEELDDEPEPRARPQIAGVGVFVALVGRRRGRAGLGVGPSRSDQPKPPTTTVGEVAPAPTGATPRPRPKEPAPTDETPRGGREGARAGGEARATVRRRARGREDLRRR